MRTSILACLFLLLPSVVLPTVLDPLEVERFFDASFEIQKYNQQLAGSVVAVVQDGKVLFKKGYGYADIENRVEVDPDRTLFRIASISKTFVWTAVMQLVDTGKLDLDADVNDYLDFAIPATYPEPITLKTLMTHTPGFEDVGTGTFGVKLDDYVALAEYLPRHIPARVRPAGMLMSYSNYGTALAGYIVERVSGMPWDEYVEENVLAVLEMNSTNVRTPMIEKLAERLAKGYKFGGGAFAVEPYWYAFEAPAGVISSSGSDMASYMIAHLQLGGSDGSRILSEAAARKMQSVAFRHHPQVDPMLYGFFETTRSGVRTIGHGGDVNQFHSLMQLAPEHDLGVFIAFNSDPGSVSRSHLMNAFFDRFFPQPKPEHIETPEALRASLADYAGEYANLRRNYSTFEKMGVLVSAIEITHADGELLIGGGGSTSRWIMEEPDIFRGKYSNRRLVFGRDDSGRVRNLFSGSGVLGKLDFIDAPSNHRVLLGLIAFLSACTLLGYGYRAISRGRNTRLNPIHVIVAWSTAALILWQFWGLVTGLSDNDAFVFGVPDYAQRLLNFAWVIAGLSVLVALFSVQQWLSGQGTLASRSRYGLFAVAGLINLWSMIYWNQLAYLLS
ncbi:MAG: serine hydrolase [Gammaproteobacteria bacterium]|nr:serine hydrolase [Gammaproteobacteria bacterium]